MEKEYTDDLMLDFGQAGDKLIPVVTQNFLTKEVLILSYVNKESFEETRKTGYATYFSRSRGKIWKKGLTSGDFLKIKEIRINCEQNSLLFLVIPEGDGACHARKTDGSHYKSCYYRRILPDDKLEFTDK
jgi:phosphoribosyl-AMP cyclohydrolase